MKASLVSDLLTPCTGQRFAQVLRVRLGALMGTPPTDRHVAVLWAQSMLESGRLKSMHRFNPGNIKASQSWEFLYCQYRCNEIIDKVVRWFDPPHPQCNFRAFLDLETGLDDYLAFLARRQSWEAAKAGDPAQFVHVLKVADHYFTADEEPYRRAVVSLTNEGLRLLAQPERDTEPPPDPAEDKLHAEAIFTMAADPDRLLHTAAVQAMLLGQEGMWDAITEERNRNLAED